MIWSLFYITHLILIITPRNKGYLCLHLTDEETEAWREYTPKLHMDWLQNQGLNLGSLVQGPYSCPLHYLLRGEPRIRKVNFPMHLYHFTFSSIITEKGSIWGKMEIFKVKCMRCHCENYTYTLKDSKLLMTTSF